MIYQLGLKMGITSNPNHIQSITQKFLLTNLQNLNEVFEINEVDEGNEVNEGNA